MPYQPGLPSGAYREENTGIWRTFDTPVRCVNNHKADVLDDIVKHPMAWFPQLKTRGDWEELEDGRTFNPIDHLRSLKMEGIVLVDDQRSNFHSDTGRKVL